MDDKIKTYLEDKKVQYISLVAITLLAGIMRFYKLGEWGFWYDEIFTLRDVNNIFDLGLLDQQLSRVFIYLSVNQIGTSEWSARLVPALVGIISIPILFFPIRKMFGSGVALLCSLFLAIAPWHLYWSQNARFYTTLLLFYTLALFLVYFALEEDKPWYIFFAFILFGLAVQERLFSVLLVPVVGLYLIALWLLPIEKPAGFRARNILLMVIPTFIIGLVGSYRFIANPERWQVAFGWINTNPFWILSGVIFYIGIPFLVMGTMAAIYYLIRKNRAVLLLTLAALIPILVIVILSMFQYSANRYAFVTLTSWLILTGIGVWELFSDSRGLTWILAIGVLLILVLAPLSESVLYYQFQNGNRADWKSPLTLVNQIKKTGDKVVVTNTRLGDYYSEGYETENYRRLFWEGNRPTDEGRLWFIVDNNLEDKLPAVLHWVEQNSELIANFDVNIQARTFKMRVYLYDPAQS
jgi:chromate transport protein ChrA